MLEELKEKAEKVKAESEAQTLKRASQFHRAFEQNEAGQKILAGWVERVLTAPVSTDPNVLLEREGRRALVKEVTRSGRR